MSKKKNIDSICFHAAFWPALGLVGLSILIVIVLFGYQLNSIRDREQHRHELISELFIKSGNADIIIGNKHALYVMLNEYKEKYHLNDIQIKNLQEVSNAHLLTWSNQVNSSWPIPGVTPTQHVIIRSEINNKDLVAPLISSFGIIALFVMASILMFKRIKRKLNEQIIVPLSQTLKSEGHDLEWFDQTKAANEISELYQRSYQFIRTLHEQRDVIESNNVKQAKYDVALQMAHDIRSPALALRTLIDLTDNLKEESKQLIRSVTYRISQISEDLLKEYRPSSEQDKLYDTCRTIGEIVKDVFNEKKLAAHNEKISFSLSIDANSYHTISKIPEEEIARILDNLINNSIESIRLNGAIELTLGVEIDYIKINIKDTGDGIPSEILPYIFDKGFSFNKEKGNGLGLAYVKDLIERYNGVLNLESSWEVGTTIQIGIPII